MGLQARRGSAGGRPPRAPTRPEDRCHHPPHLFQDPCYRCGTFGHNDPVVRAAALQHGVDSVAIGKAVGGDCLSRWFADGTNYPAQGSIRTRKQAFEEARRALHQTLGPKQAMLVDYKPFEPAFYATDIADWGMALLLA